MPGKAGCWAVTNFKQKVLFAHGWLAQAATELRANSLHGFSRPARLDISIAGQIGLAVGIAPVHHRALVAAQVELADVGAHGRLLVDGAEFGRAEGRGEAQAAQRDDQLFVVRRVGFLDKP